MLKMKATGFCSVLLLFFLHHEKNDASLQVLNKAQHYWPFDRHYGIIDVTTNVTGLKYGNVKNIYFEGPRDSFLHTNGRAWIDLGNFTGSCLGEPWRCKGALTVFTWLRYYPHKSKKYFVGTASHLSRQEGFSIYKESDKQGGNFTVVTVNDGKTEWSGHFPLKPEIWAHVAFTWDSETGLSLFHNCRQIALVSEGRTIIYEKSNKSKLLEHHLTLSGGIKSHPHAGTKAAYDDLTVMYRAINQSEWSQICYHKLEPPQMTKSCQGSSRYLIITWTSPRMTYDILEGFHVWFTSNSSSRQWSNVAQFRKETFFNFTGLEPGTTYKFRIQNAFVFGVGKTSDTMECKTTKEVLGPPVNLTVEMTSSSAVVIKWNGPVGGAKDVLGYKIKYRALHFNDESRTVNVVPFRTQFLITKLSKNTKYRVQVTSYGNYGFTASQPSEIIAKTDANNTKSVTEIYKELLGAQTIRITWKKPSDKYKVFAYRVFVKWSMLGHEKNILPLYDGNKTEYNYSMSNLASSLTFHVMAYVLSVIPLIPVRDPPQNVTIVSLGWSYITMNWTSPFHKHIVDFADLYQLTVKSDKAEIFFTTANTHARIDGLRQLTKYLVNMQAWNGLGFGPFRTNDIEIMTLDRNECADGSNMCHVNADCSNTEGSYSCECKPGFIGDGRDCEQEPEGLSEDLFCGAEKLAGVKWQKNLVNRQAAMPCPQGTVGLAFRRCTGSPAVWHLPDLSDCVSKWMSDINQQLANPNESVLSVANQLSNFTDVKSGKPLYAGDLKLLVDVIGVLSQRGLDISNDNSSNDQANSFIKAVIGTASNIVDSKNLVSWRYMPQDSQAEKASSLIDSMDTVALDLANSSQTNQENTENVVMTVKSLVDVTDPWDLVMRQISDQEEVTSSNTVLFPSSVLRGEPSSEKPNFATFVSFKTLGPLLTPKENNRDQRRNTESMTVNSAVVSLNLRPLSTRRFQEPVVIILRHSVENEEKDQPKCAFLDKEKNDSWSEVGCKVNATNTTHTVCHCYHLTSFAVLMSVRQDVSSSINKEHQLALSVITYVGVSISIVALCLAFLTFHFFRFSSSGRTFIHKNLAMGLIFAQLVFLFGIGKTANQWVCKGIAIALHYFFLVAFSWMALEGVMLYLMLVKVFHTKTAPTKTKKIFFCVGWGLPVAIVVAAGVVFHEGYGTPSYCWLSLDRGFIWSFVGPVLLVLLFNFMCLGMTFQVMARKGPASNKKRTNKIRKWTKACMLLTCILGLTWLFGVFYINQESLFMAYFFTIFNTLQGLFIFLFHCIGDEKIRREYHRMLCCIDRDKQYLLSKQSESSSSKSESRPSRNTLENFKNKNQTITSSASSVGTIESKKNTFIVHVTDGQVQIRGVRPDAVSRDYMSTHRQSQASFTSFGQPANKDRNSAVRHSTASKASEAQESDQEVQLQLEGHN